MVAMVRYPELTPCQPGLSTPPVLCVLTLSTHGEVGTHHDCPHFADKNTEAQRG